MYLVTFHHWWCDRRCMTFYLFRWFTTDTMSQKSKPSLWNWLWCFYSRSLYIMNVRNILIIQQKSDHLHSQAFLKCFSDFFRQSSAEGWITGATVWVNQVSDQLSERSSQLEATGVTSQRALLYCTCVFLRRSIRWTELLLCISYWGRTNSPTGWRTQQQLLKVTCHDNCS